MSRRSRKLLLLATLLASLSLASTAQAAAPTLISVGQQDRHATGTLSAPTADDVTVYYASKPDRATDGSFLDENIKDRDFLTADEIQRGTWLSSSQLDPGVYYVMVSASSYRTECYEGADCMDGYSSVMTLTIPKPARRFKASIERDILSSFKLTVTHLGEPSLPYKLCWNRAKGRKKCLRSKVVGYDWNGPSSDVIYIILDDLKLGKHQTRVTFKWCVAGRKVASKRLRLRR